MSAENATDSYAMMRRLAAHPCESCARGDHDNCDNEEANAGAVFADEFILVCVCNVCQEAAQ